jgi:hypothetical protein
MGAVAMVVLVFAAVDGWCATVYSLPPVAANCISHGCTMT